MNFFKKLFASKEKKLKSRATRIPSNFLNNISLLIDIEEKPRRFPLQNISETGLSVSCGGNTNLFPMGELLEGEVTAKGRSVFFEAEVVRHSSDNIGLKVTRHSREFRTFVTNYFKEELSLLKVVKVAKEKLKPESDGEPHWYMGDDNCEFFYVTSEEGALVRFELTLFGNVIERNSTGEVHCSLFWDDSEDEEEARPAYKGSRMLRRSGAVQNEQDLVPMARKFLSLMQDLPTTIKVEVEKTLQSLVPPKE